MKMNENKGDHLCGNFHLGSHTYITSISHKLLSVAQSDKFNRFKDRQLYRWGVTGK